MEKKIKRNSSSRNKRASEPRSTGLAAGTTASTVPRTGAPSRHGHWYLPKLCLSFFFLIPLKSVATVEITAKGKWE